MKIKISNTLLNCLLAALATGIVFAENFQPSIKIFVAVCAASMAVGLIITWRKKIHVAKIIAPIIFFVLGALRFYAVDTIPPNDISKFELQTVAVTGIVREEPTEKFLPNDLKQLRLIVDVESVKIKGVDSPVSGGLILTSYNDFKTARIGDKKSRSNRHGCAYEVRRHNRANVSRQKRYRS